MSWKVELTNNADRDLRQLPGGPKREALNIIETLMEEGPDGVSSTEMDHYPGRFKTRFYREAYRFIFDVSAKRKFINVVRIRPRDTAYIGLKRSNP